MAACFNKLGADRAHGAIIGREGLVELRHVSANGGFRLDKVDPEALIGEVQAGLHAGNTATNDHNSANRRLDVGAAHQVEGVCLRSVTQGAPLPWLGASILGISLQR